MHHHLPSPKPWPPATTDGAQCRRRPTSYSPPLPYRIQLQRHGARGMQAWIHGPPIRSRTPAPCLASPIPPHPWTLEPTFGRHPGCLRCSETQAKVPRANRARPPTPLPTTSPVRAEEHTVYYVSVPAAPPRTQPTSLITRCQKYQTRYLDRGKNLAGCTLYSTFSRLGGRAAARARSIIEQPSPTLLAKDTIPIPSRCVLYNSLRPHLAWGLQQHLRGQHVQTDVVGDTYATSRVPCIFC